MLAYAVNELIDNRPIMRAPYTADLVDSGNADEDRSGRIFSDAGEQDRRDDPGDDERRDERPGAD